MAVMQLVVLAAIFFAAQASEFGLPERRSMLERGMATLKTHRSLSAKGEAPVAGPAAGPGEGPAPKGEFKATVKFVLTLPYTKASFDEAAQKTVIGAVAKGLKINEDDLKVGDVKEVRRHLLAGLEVSFVATVYGASSSAVSDLTESIATALDGDLEALKGALEAAGIDTSSLKVSGVEVSEPEEVASSMSPDWAPGEGPAGDAYEATVTTTLTIGGYDKTSFTANYDTFITATADYLNVKPNALHVTGGKKAITRHLLAGSVTVPLTTNIYGATEAEVKTEANDVAEAIDDNAAFESALKSGGLSAITSFSATPAEVSSVMSLLGSANTKAVAVAVAGVAAALALFL